MEATVNRVEIQGFLGSDAQVRTFDSGRTLVTLRVATSESFKNGKGEWVTTTTWHTVTLWSSRKDEPMGLLKKGTLVSIAGKLHTRKYTDKQGQERFVTEVLAQRVEPAGVGA